MTAFRHFFFFLLCNLHAWFDFGKSPQSSGHSQQDPGCWAASFPPWATGFGACILQGSCLKKDAMKYLQKRWFTLERWWWRKKPKSFWEKKAKLCSWENPHRETTLKKASRSCQTLWSCSPLWAVACCIQFRTSFCLCSLHKGGQGIQFWPVLQEGRNLSSDGKGAKEISWQSSWASLQEGHKASWFRGGFSAPYSSLSTPGRPLWGQVSQPHCSRKLTWLHG